MKEVLRDGKGRQREEREEANKLAPESIQIIPIARKPLHNFLSLSQLRTAALLIFGFIEGL